jgi:hypothetical protein
MFFCLKPLFDKAFRQKNMLLYVNAVNLANCPSDHGLDQIELFLWEYRSKRDTPTKIGLLRN